MDYELEQELGKVKYKTKTGFVICTRTDSSRLPNKPFQKINGISVIEHLIHRLQKNNLPIIIAFPREQAVWYEDLATMENVYLHPSTKRDDPLARMYEAAANYDLDIIIRVSHDKILVDYTDVQNALFEFYNLGFEYLYSSKFTAGSGFEIISRKSLQKAVKKFRKVEYIGYAVRAVTEEKKICNYNPRHQRLGQRYLIDYPNDLKLFDVLFSQLGNNCSLGEANKYLIENPELKEINRLPELTIYTCAYNAEKWIERCMDSVARQKHFSRWEYIIIDDCSSDKTCEAIAKFAVKYKNVTWIRNGENKGLSSSSNIALKEAKGKYILRLDADDYFVSVTALDQMLKEMKEQEVDALYPNNYFGSLNTIQKGNEKHHVGGTMFNRDAINHLKFTDGLNNHDSLDVFLRAKGQLKIGYFDKAMFFYFQHGTSMSKNNLEEREKTKENLMLKYLWSLDDEDDDLDFRELGVDIEPNH